MMIPVVRGIYVHAIGEKALVFEAARLNELTARKGRAKALRMAELSLGSIERGDYARGDDEDLDLALDCHAAAARAKSNARRSLSTAIRNFHLSVKRLA